jgi:hypothetical protein
LVCRGANRLRSLQTRIEANWQRLYEQVFGVAPAG